MSRDKEILDAKLLMANILAEDMPNASPDSFMECVSVAADGLLAAKDSVEFHHIIQSNGLTIDE